MCKAAKPLYEGRGWLRPVTSLCSLGDDQNGVVYASYKCLGSRFDETKQFSSRIVVLEPKPISGGPSLVDWRLTPACIDGTFPPSGNETLPKRVEGQRFVTAIEEMPIDGKNDREDSYSPCEAGAQRQRALSQSTKPGLTFGLFVLGALAEINAIQRVGEFHPLYINAENSNKEGQMKNEVEYERDGRKNAKVGDPGRDEPGAEVQ